MLFAFTDLTSWSKPFRVAVMTCSFILSLAARFAAEQLPRRWRRMLELSPAGGGGSDDDGAGFCGGGRGSEDDRAGFGGDGRGLERCLEAYHGRLGPLLLLGGFCCRGPREDSPPTRASPRSLTFTRVASLGGRDRGGGLEEGLGGRGGGGLGGGLEERVRLALAVAHAALRRMILNISGLTRNVLCLHDDEGE